jgi:hypothetical protein
LTDQAIRLLLPLFRDKTIFSIDSSGLSGKRFDEECHRRDAKRNRKRHLLAKRGVLNWSGNLWASEAAPSSVLDPKKGRD